MECVIRLTQIFKCKWERERGSEGRDGETRKRGRVRDCWGAGRFMKRLIWGLAGRPCAKNRADLLKVSVYWTDWMRSFTSIQRDTFGTFSSFCLSIRWVRQSDLLRCRLILSFILHSYSLKRKRRKSWRSLESRLAFPHSGDDESLSVYVCKKQITWKNQILPLLQYTYTTGKFFFLPKVSEIILPFCKPNEKKDCSSRQKKTFDFQKKAIYSITCKE